ncbi:unnamed protein product [Heligmosomoides polygyrus]|uniref:BLM10_mid domain-containing protein n=1 Tax=Heligmosomoides polygyrus TaxID=6339 RepID=A0A183GXI4_HELPZ|nr:unnamed protein product [Heligmosomoides polygyrus]
MWAESHTGGKEPAWQKAYLDYMFRLFDASAAQHCTHAALRVLKRFLGILQSSGPITLTLLTPSSSLVEDKKRTIHSPSIDTALVSKEL